MSLLQVIASIWLLAGLAYLLALLYLWTRERMRGSRPGDASR